MYSMKINNTKIYLARGDITDFDVDAIVNAANTDLILGGGVAGAIRLKGGPSIQEECNKHGRIPLGGATITNGGNLKAKYVIHAASMHLGGKTTASSLRDSVINSLKIAEQYKLSSIAFPAIGTGIAGFSLIECAKIIRSVFEDFFNNHSSYLREVYMVLYSHGDFEVFKQNFL
ncbi:MAG: macro domain-containing protein [Candidatus Heimdallarchaeaceae archaeon]